MLLSAELLWKATPVPIEGDKRVELPVAGLIPFIVGKVTYAAFHDEHLVGTRLVGPVQERENDLHFTPQQAEEDVAECEPLVVDTAAHRVEGL